MPKRDLPFNYQTASFGGKINHSSDGRFYWGFFDDVPQIQFCYSPDNFALSEWIEVSDGGFGEPVTDVISCSKPLTFAEFQAAVQNYLQATEYLDF